MMTRLLEAAKTGTKVAFITLIIAAIIAFAGSPVFFGMVIITASVMMTVYIYSMLGFLLGFCFKYFKMRPKDEPQNSYN